GDDVDGGHLEEPEQVDLAIPARADQPDSFPLRRGECRGRREAARTREDQPARSRSGLEEFATIHDLAPRLRGRWQAVVKAPHKIASRLSHVNLPSGPKRKSGPSGCPGARKTGSELTGLALPAVLEAEHRSKDIANGNRADDKMQPVYRGQEMGRPSE